MSRRKDRERFLRMKERNPDYVGFRGDSTAVTAAAAPAPTVVTVACSVCQRRRNVPEDTLPEDRDTFVCLQCQERQAEEGTTSNAE